MSQNLYEEMQCYCKTHGLEDNIMATRSLAGSQVHSSRFTKGAFVLDQLTFLDNMYMNT